jgi:phage terminase large subunit GpA-like protein
MGILTEGDREFLLKIFESAPSKRPIEDIAAWVEGRRMLPQSSPIPGAWHNSVTPYGVEIMNSLSPNSGIQRVVIMKARKVGMTTILENAVAYYMLENPSEIIYATASEDLAKDWADKKIGAVIESLGGLGKITANTTNAKQRRTGDTSGRKEYIGGSLDIISSQSKRARRALDKRVLFIDEVDGLAPLTTTGEGKWTEILFGHTASWGAKRKIVLFGSPTTIEESLTDEYYRQGDCRHFFVPCPWCGELIELRLDIESSSPYGLKAETKGGKIIDAYYLCERCGEPIRNDQKIEMFSETPAALKFPEKKVHKYQWQPTKKPDDEAWRSYYINSLYSPVGMLTFLDIAKERSRAESGTPEDMRSYTNIFIGLPFKDAASRPRLSAVLEHRGTCARGTVPPGVLFLTAAVDVQEGYRNDPSRPERLEIMIMGIGKSYRAWVIDYKVFEGSTEDPYSGAWEDLYQWLREINGTFYSAPFSNGVRIPFSISTIFVDSGDASKTKNGVSRSDIVYRYCERHSPLAFPIKGFANLKPRRGESPDADIPGAASYKKFRVSKIGSGGENVVEIATAHYKGVLFGRLKIGKTRENPFPNGYFEVFADASEDFFIQLTNSEALAGGAYRDIGDHEVLDCAIYCYAAADAFLQGQVRIMKDTRRAAGMDPLVIEMTTNAKTVLEYFEARIAAFGAAPLDVSAGLTNP